MDLVYPYHARVNFLCKYFKKPGHLKGKCYKLHDFPIDFKLSRGKNTTSPANTHVTSVESLDGKFDSMHWHGGDT